MMGHCEVESTGTDPSFRSYSILVTGMVGVYSLSAAVHTDSAKLPEDFNSVGSGEVFFSWDSPHRAVVVSTNSSKCVRGATGSGI